MKHFFTLFFLIVFTVSGYAQTETVTLRTSLYFASASHQPAAEELAQLADFAATLTSYAEYSLKIEAFTDEQGTPAYNDALARRRAAAVTRVLATHAVIPTTTEVLAYGEQRAKTNTRDDQERRADRRVDLLATVVRWADASAAIQAARTGQLQALTIADPTVRQTISGRQGGVFMLEPNTLVRPDGSPAVGPVSVKLAEAYDLSDMILAGLTTTAAGQRLVTGGMVSLTATDADGANLQLREGTALTASIPTDDFNERMRIFSGAGHNDLGGPTDWALTAGGVADSPETLFITATQLPEVTAIEVDARKLVGPRMARWRQANPKPKQPTYLNPESIKARPPKEVNLEQVTYRSKGIKGLFMSKARKEQELAAIKAKTKAGYDRKVTRYQERIAFRDRLPEINAEKRQDYALRLAAWEMAFEQVKKGLMDEASQTLYAAAEKRIEAMRAARAARLAAIGKELAGLDDLTGAEINVRRYFFSIAKLGWANVDIYAGAEDRIEVLANVLNSTREATVVMVPADSRSVLAYSPALTGGWKCSGIARGVGYHILAYQVLNGQLMLAHQFVESASTQPAALQYAPVAVRELKDKLAGILGS